MLAPELLAAMASGCWAIGALFSANAASQMGAFAFTRWRLFFAMCLLWIAAIYVGRWPELTFESIAWLSVSSWIGILVGDTALFVCMNRLGPRRSGVLFATHALFSALLAWLFLGETLWGWTLMGSSVLVSGVMVATLWGRREEETHVWENTSGTLWFGVAMGLLAAAGQAVAAFARAIIHRPQLLLAESPAAEESPPSTEMPPLNRDVFELIVIPSLPPSRFSTRAVAPFPSTPTVNSRPDAKVSTSAGCS